MYLQGICIVAFQGKPYHLSEFRRECVSYYGYYAYCSKRDQRVCYSVIARNDGKIGRFVLYYFINLHYVPGCFFYGNDILVVACQTQYRIGRHVYACSARHIVKDNGQIGRFGYCLVMAVYSFLQQPGKRESTYLYINMPRMSLIRLKSE